MFRKRSALIAAALLGLIILAFVAGFCLLSRESGWLGLPIRPTARHATALAKKTATVQPSPTATLSLPQRLALNPMPPRDYVALANDLRDDDITSTGAPIPRVVRDTPHIYYIGDKERFWIGDTAMPHTWQITATLRFQTARLQMWVEDGANVNQEALVQSATEFSEHIYPTNHHYFGREWTPGVDGDAHLVVLNALFEGAAGYFASANEYSREINPYSNEREMFIMNLNALKPGTASYNAVLAHEFQHMIHWHLDDNEDAWLNEGASVLAEDLNGYSPLGMIHSYELMPDVQLNAWTDDSSQALAHYGASYLIMRYFLNRYGTDARGITMPIYSLVQEPSNGLASFDAVLQAQGEPGFDDLFADWLVANVLDDPAIEDGRYAYPQIDVQAKSILLGRGEQQLEAYPAPEGRFLYVGQVHQYGADYIEFSSEQASAGAPLQAKRSLRISFQGKPTVQVVPVEPTSGRYFWWSNQGDGSHSWLERTFDLSHAATATLSFNLWYDIERGWDYAYVRVSTDGGAHWQLVRGKHMTDYNPHGNALGPGYTGVSSKGQAQDQPLLQEEATDAKLGTASRSRWVREHLDLSEFCGKPGAQGDLRVRFDYVTDEVFTRPGLCLDDLQLKVAGWGENAGQAQGITPTLTLVWEDDVETGDDGAALRYRWQASGFVRHDNVLPQRYLVQWVTYRSGAEPLCEVRLLPVNADGQGEWIVDLPNDGATRALLIVSAITRNTKQTVPYRLEFEPEPPAGSYRVLPQ